MALSLAFLLMWLAAAGITAQRLRHEMDVVFDGALRDTAHRLLPLALRGGGDYRDRERGGRDHRERDHDGEFGHELFERVQRLPETEELYGYVIFDEDGRVILSSAEVDPAIFPPFEREGFVQTADYRFFYEHAGRFDVTIAVAEPLSHRAAVARDMAMSLSLPLLFVIPLSLGAIFFVIRSSLAPMRALRDDLGDRGARNLDPLEDRGLPSELAPVVASLNSLLARLKAAFEAERSFAANAAHELRTPVAGAIAQAQRLRAETADAAAAGRAGEIETTLKRLNSLSEKLMQLARAEGARLRTEGLADMRPILRMIVQDFDRLGTAGRIRLSMAEEPVLSDLDPDAFGILSRNLIENALKHGSQGATVEVSLAETGRLSVSNAGPAVAPGDLARLTARFARANGQAEGSGLGLAIVQTISQRAEAAIDIRSPRRGQTDGVEVIVCLPGRA